LNFLHTPSFSAFAIGSLCLCLLACGPTRPPEQSKGHISDVPPAANDIPRAVTQTTLLPAPQARPKLETYTVVVSGVPTKDLLFSMARDAKINLDIHEDIEGKVTLNAIDQTLEQILDRIAQQTDIRYSLDKNTLRVRADKPYLETYKVDYVNISRKSKGVIRVATNIGSTGQGEIGQNSGSGTSGGSTGGNSSSQNNSSLTEVNLESNNAFWETLSSNIIEILDDNSDSQLNRDSNKNSNVIVNKEAGLIMVRASHKKHQQIQTFIDQVLNNSKRQVMIEATIAEIKLSDSYQTGVDWSVVATDGNSGLNILSDFTGSNLVQSPFSSLTLSNTSGGDQVNVALRALEEFGDVKVLSSPKVMAINNQPAILKVVDNIVYFEMQVDTALSENSSASLTSFETQIKTVPVGFVMAVTPYINEHNVVTLNIRPTISRVIDNVEDPNPAFRNADVISSVPVIQVREIESILSINSGDTAVIGGLMQDTVNDRSSGVPLLSDIPILGNFFKYKNDSREKSELIIFIRPLVINHASLNSDLSEFKQFLPGNNSKRSTDNREQNASPSEQ
jgi:general secretion pathway protein D